MIDYRGDHDAEVMANVNYTISLGKVRVVFEHMLDALSKTSGFKGDISGAFSWSAGAVRPIP